MDNTSGNVLGDAAESFYGSAVTSQRSKTEVGLLRPSILGVRFGRTGRAAEEEPLYPERFPVNSTHRGGTLGVDSNQRGDAVPGKWDSAAAAAAAADNDYGDDEDSVTMVSRQKSLNRTTG